MSYPRIATQDVKILKVVKVHNICTQKKEIEPKSTNVALHGNSETRIASKHLFGNIPTKERK